MQDMSPLDYGNSSDDSHEEEPYEGFCQEEDDSERTQSSSSENERSEEGGDNVIRVSQGIPVWTGVELKIVADLKDRWFHGTSDDQKHVLDEGVKALVDLEHRDPVTTRKKLAKWLRRRAGKRLNYGPGNRPSFQTVLAYYKEAEVAETVRRVHGVVAGGKNSPFLGLWKKELGQLQRALKTDPDRKQDFDWLESAREEWMRRGPPRDRRKK